MRISASTRRSAMVSALLHVGVMLAVVAAFRLHPIVVERPMQAGTPQGTLRTVLYNPGAAPAPPPSSVPTPPHRALTLRPQAAPPSTPSAPPIPAPGVSGSRSSGEGSQGEGDITIALVRFHPRPSPDLSALAPGTGGDVILDATIDAQGHIAKLSVAHGLSPAIDSTVLATVQQWTFAPATRAGIPTPSEQQILFHYERS